MYDEEFGDITIRRSVRASTVKISVAPGGTLRASLPPYAPLFVLRRLIKSSRGQLRKMLEQQLPIYQLQHGMTVGKSHRLIVEPADTTAVKRRGQQLIVSLAPDDSLTSPKTERMVRDAIIAALRVEAKSYLPKRLAFMANKLGCRYDSVRFSHASSRWGSCSSRGTISLNIALMSLPFELIDYVIIHELSHTKQMNHSPKFWELVEAADPDYKIHRRELKKHNPTI